MTRTFRPRRRPPEATCRRRPRYALGRRSSNPPRRAYRTWDSRCRVTRLVIRAKKEGQKHGPTSLKRQRRELLSSLALQACGPMVWSCRPNQETHGGCPPWAGRIGLLLALALPLGDDDLRNLLVVLVGGDGGLDALL